MNNEINNSGGGEIAILFMGLIIAYFSCNMLGIMADVNEEKEMAQKTEKVSKKAPKSIDKSKSTDYVIIKKVIIRESIDSTYYYLKLLSLSDEKRTHEVDRLTFVEFEQRDTITLFDTLDDNGSIVKTAIK